MGCWFGHDDDLEEVSPCRDVAARSALPLAFGYARFCRLGGRVCCAREASHGGNASESANYLVEAALGDHSSRVISGWSPPDGYDQVAVSCLVPDHPNV